MLPAWGGVSYYLSSPFCRNLYIRGVVVAVPNNTSQRGKHWRFKPAVRARKCHGWKLKNPTAADGASASKLQARCKARHDGRWWAFFCRFFFFLQTLPIVYISFKKNGWSPSRVKTVRLQWPLYRHVVTPANLSSRTKIGSDVGFAEYWCSVVSKGRGGVGGEESVACGYGAPTQTQRQIRQRLKVCSEVVFLYFALDCKSVARTFRFPWRIEWNRIIFAKEAELHDRSFFSSWDSRPLDMIFLKVRGNFLRLQRDYKNMVRMC